MSLQAVSRRLQALFIMRVKIMDFLSAPVKLPLLTVIKLSFVAPACGKDLDHHC